MWADLRAAFLFLTVLPIGAIDVTRKPGYSFAYYPVVGMCIGAIVGCIMVLPIAPDLRAFAALIVWVILTGGLHLDGFADSCDGLFVTAAPERRLEIMKDPRTGSFAVVGLCLLLLGKYIALRSILPWTLISVAIFGRWAMVYAIFAFPPARAGGLAAYFRDGLGRTQFVIATVLTVLIVGVVAVITGEWRVFAMGAAVIGVVWVVGRWAAQRLGGGLTGDVYGFLCEGVELLCLVLLTVR
jgi:adenosylcobinamide-GDP ribazoletransferase